MAKLWYPDRDFIVKAHEEALMDLGSGGHPGFERGIDAFDHILLEARQNKGSIYRKAAIFLKGLTNARIFLDGNHRTAFVVADTFLRMNGLKINTQNTKNVIRFIKDIKEYTIEQVEVWLEHGKMP